MRFNILEDGQDLGQIMATASRSFVVLDHFSGQTDRVFKAEFRQNQWEALTGYAVDETTDANRFTLTPQSGGNYQLESVIIKDRNTVAVTAKRSLK